MNAVSQICGLIWALTMIIGCAYLVFWKGQSGWWFVLAVMLAASWEMKS